MVPQSRLDHEDFRTCQNSELRTIMAIPVACSEMESVSGQLQQLTRGFEKLSITGILLHYVKVVRITKSYP